MTIRNAALGLAVVFSLSFWAWCRHSGPEAKARGADVIHSAGEPGVGAGGNRDEALARYRANQSRHWRQVAIGGGVQQ
jgi:hypothetical protein